MARISRTAFCLSGAGAAACMLLLAFAGPGLSRWWMLILIQMFLVPICFVSSAVFLWATRREERDPLRGVAAIAAILSGLEVAFLVDMATSSWIVLPGG